MLQIEHLLTLGELAREFPESNIDRSNPELSLGLSSEEVKEKARIYGVNRLTPPKRLPWFLRFLKQFTGFFHILLLTGGVLCFIAFFIQLSDPDASYDNVILFIRDLQKQLYLGIVLFIVVIATGIFTFVQESKSAALMEGFKLLISEYTNVIRDGKRSFVPAESIVPGDLVELRAGNKV